MKQHFLIAIVLFSSPVLAGEVTNLADQLFKKLGVGTRFPVHNIADNRFLFAYIEDAGRGLRLRDYAEKEEIELLLPAGFADRFDGQNTTIEKIKGQYILKHDDKLTGKSSELRLDTRGNVLHVRAQSHSANQSSPYEVSRLSSGPETYLLRASGAQAKVTLPDELGLITVDGVTSSADKTSVTLRMENKLGFVFNSTVELRRGQTAEHVIDIEQLALPMQTGPTPGPRALK